MVSSLDEFPHLNLYSRYVRSEWLKLLGVCSLELSSGDLSRLSGVNEVVSQDEIKNIYMPLSRLIRLRLDHAKSLSDDVSAFLASGVSKLPFIVGVSGSVASGKSTTSRVLRELLSRDASLSVKVVSTDGFLKTNQQLADEGLTERKGFPESYNLDLLLRFLFDLKAGVPLLEVPVYSHILYDIVPDVVDTIDDVDVVIIEGLNILQTGASSLVQQKAFVSDFLDFTVFVDASLYHLRQWYVERLLTLSDGAMQSPDAYFHHLTIMPRDKLVHYAEKIWSEINEVNLIENILPYRYRADCILHKGDDHNVEAVSLRSL